MVLSRLHARILKYALYAFPASLLLLFPPAAGALQAKGGKGAAKPPEPRDVPDPEAQAAKEKAASEKEKMNARRGQSRSIATSPQGVLGSAPASRPELKGSLG